MSLSNYFPMYFKFASPCLFSFPAWLSRGATTLALNTTVHWHHQEFLGLCTLELLRASALSVVFHLSESSNPWLAGQLRTCSASFKLSPPSGALLKKREVLGVVPWHFLGLQPWVGFAICLQTPTWHWQIWWGSVQQAARRSCIWPLLKKGNALGPCTLAVLRASAFSGFYHLSASSQLWLTDLRGKCSSNVKLYMVSWFVPSWAWIPISDTCSILRRSSFPSCSKRSKLIKVLQTNITDEL